MMRGKSGLAVLTIILAIGCGNKGEPFQHFSEQFADLYLVRYNVPGFTDLPLRQKQLLYYLYEAALSGRDIFYDQNYKHNLRVRKTLEAIVHNYSGDRTTEEFGQFMVYTKRVWFSNGIHHHYSMDKIEPGFSAAYFGELVAQSATDNFPTDDGQSVDELLAFLTPIMFDPAVAPKKVNLAVDIDQVQGSAVNFYSGVTQKEVEQFYSRMTDPNDPTPISYGLNSKLVKEDGIIREVIWKVDGMYGAALERVVYWLEKAIEVAENEKQEDALQKLVIYYRSGELEDFDTYNIAWVADVDSDIDVINGFIEVYDDPLGYRASYEAVVQLKDPVASRRMDAIADEAQWFEDHSPIMDAHKKANVKGIIANVINVVIEAGATSPASPIGINLPNSSWIRKEHGSKSVSLGNIVDAYNGARAGNGFIEEFAFSQEEIDRRKEFGTVAANLHVDMHEVIGHASGQLELGVGTTRETLKSYASALEEGRADLVALYFVMDQKLIDIGVMPSMEVGKTEYDGY
ncbi:MAG: dihydrofolate reductase, partial [Candidatus Marinimicrobia bacterium]|nr:dihydrofolate reductase [Candidatus Neomarinimicrobiota bacterium]